MIEPDRLMVQLCPALLDIIQNIYCRLMKSIVTSLFVGCHRFDTPFIHSILLSLWVVEMGWCQSSLTILWRVVHSFLGVEKLVVRKKIGRHTSSRIDPHQSPRVDFLHYALHLQPQHSQYYSTTISDSVVYDALSHVRKYDSNVQAYDTLQVEGKLQHIRYWVDHMVGRMLELSYFLAPHIPCNVCRKHHLPLNRHNPLNASR